MVLMCCVETRLLRDASTRGHIMTSTAVRMTLQWYVPVGQSRSIIDALHELMVVARATHGCLGCSLATDVGTHADVRYTEDWVDEQILRRELRSDRFTTLATLLESSSRPPLVEFRLPDGTRGLEYAAEVRAAPPN